MINPHVPKSPRSLSASPEEHWPALHCSRGRWQVMVQRPARVTSGRYVWGNARTASNQLSPFRRLWPHQSCSRPQTGMIAWKNLCYRETGMAAWINLWYLKTGMMAWTNFQYRLIGLLHWHYLETASLDHCWWVMWERRLCEAPHGKRWRCKRSC